MLQADLARRVRLKLTVTYFSDIQPREVITIFVILFVEKSVVTYLKQTKLITSSRLLIRIRRPISGLILTFLVINFIFHHVLFRLMQKYLSPVINCLLWCINWYSWGVTRSSHPVRIVVKFYNHTLQLRHRCISTRYNPPLVLFSVKTVIEDHRQ